jgi:hypothetical protein
MDFQLPIETINTGRIKMTTATFAKYEGSSDPSNTSTIRVLPPVEGKRFEAGATDAGIVRSSAWFAVIRARWNFLQQINIPVTNNHVVMASITELFPNPASGLLDLPGIGAAHMSVRSVAPQNGKVFVNGYIDWDRDLDIRISLFVA